MKNRNSTPANPDEVAREFGPMVTALCRRMIQDRDTARDAAQEVWVEVLRSLPSFRGDAKVSTWIFTITRRTLGRFVGREKQYNARLLSNYFSSRYGDGRPEIEAIPASGRFEWLKEQCSDCLTGILHCLDNDARLLYLFRVLTPLSYQEIASVMDKSEDAVRQSVSRSRRKVESFLDGNCHLYNPDGDCRCKLTLPLDDFGHHREVTLLKKTVGQMTFIRSLDDVLDPAKNWFLPLTKV